MGVRTARDSAETREQSSPSLAGHPHHRHHLRSRQRTTRETETPQRHSAGAARNVAGTLRDSAGRPQLQQWQATEQTDHARGKEQAESAEEPGGGPRPLLQREMWRQPVPAEFRTELKWSKFQWIVQRQQPLWVERPTTRVRQPVVPGRGMEPSAHPTVVKMEGAGEAAAGATDAGTTDHLARPAGVRVVPRAAARIRPVGAP